MRKIAAKIAKKIEQKQKTFNFRRFKYIICSFKTYLIGIFWGEVGTILPFYGVELDGEALEESDVLQRDKDSKII